MGWLGQPLGADEQFGATPFAPRCTKDVIEEQLFKSRRDLFAGLDLVFFDTTSIYFEGAGGETIGQNGHSKDHRPDLKQMVVGMILDDQRRDDSERLKGAYGNTFLALLLRKELENRLEQKGFTVEWADVIRDLDNLVEIEITVFVC